MPHLGKQLVVALVFIGAFTFGAPALEAMAAPAAPTTASALPQRGEQSLTVARLQQLLQVAGVKVAGGVDGVYGPSTAAAVRKFQLARGLPGTGTLDDATAVALGLESPTPRFAVGSHGDAVRALQQQLLAAGLRLPGGADGQFGAATASAVRQFQSARSLPVTGQVDALTAALLAGGAAPASSGQQTAPAATPAATGLPAPGASGPAVTALQRQLIAVGARPKGGADGVYGVATVNAVKVFQRWMGLPANGVLDRATADALAGAPAVVATRLTLSSFPLSPTCTFWDTWGAPRFGGRAHVGVDIFAKQGTPVLAVSDGRITGQTADFPGSLGGNQEWLTASDGSRYFYAHLQGFAKGVGRGSPVHAGDVIGFAGATGLTTVSHLHFEVHPGGGAAVDPYPILKGMTNC